MVCEITTKYRRKEFYDARRLEIGKIIRDLSEWKGVNIVEAEVCVDHVHMLVEIPPKMSVSGYVGYIKGKKDAEEVLENGIELENNESFDIDENGYYTIYAKDKVGNVTIKVIEITNIDKTAPNITINVLTKKYSSKTEVEIDYGRDWYEAK